MMDSANACCRLFAKIKLIFFEKQIKGVNTGYIISMLYQIALYVFINIIETKVKLQRVGGQIRDAPLFQFCRVFV